MNTDRAWEQYGCENPYFGVLADERYRGNTLSEAVLHEFFASGNEYIDRVLSCIDRHITPCPRVKALDFGCGVGRLAIPLAQRFTTTVGVDISPSMLREAKINTQRMGVDNLRLSEQLSELANERGTFSFVNTFIVLQHIDPQRGQTYVAQLLDLLTSGGCGAIHMTYAREKYRRSFGEKPLLSRAIQVLRRPLSALRRRIAGQDPEMQMNAYLMNRVLFLLQAGGVKEFFSEFTDHGGFFGVTLYFKKP